MYAASDLGQRTIRAVLKRKDGWMAQYIVNIYILPVKITAVLIQKKLQSVSISFIFAMLTGSVIVPYGSTAFAQQSQNKTSSQSTNNTLTNTTGAKANITSLLKPRNAATNNVALAAKMLQLEASNKPQDIATLAYIWGYPLVTIEGSYAYFTTKGVPNLGEGPVNTINFARSLSNTSWVQFVSPNVNVLYRGYLSYCWSHLEWNSSKRNA
jgi:hypothetical protein